MHVHSLASGRLVLTDVLGAPMGGDLAGDVCMYFVALGPGTVPNSLIFERMRLLHSPCDPTVKGPGSQRQGPFLFRRVYKERTFAFPTISTCENGCSGLVIRRTKALLSNLKLKFRSPPRRFQEEGDTKEVRHLTSRT